MMGQCAHLRNYATLKDCQVVALAEPRAKTAQMVATHYGVPNVYADFSDMLAAETLDAIVASQPFDRHGVLVPELLKAGIPVFTEKPIAGTIEAGERIVAADAASDGFLMVGYHKRSDPAVMWAKEQIERLKASGELGRLTYVRVLMPAGDWTERGFDTVIGAGDKMPELEMDPPAKDMSEEVFGYYGGFVNYYIHQVNMARHLLGESWAVTYADPSGVMLAGVSDSGSAVTIEMTPYRTTEGWEESALVAFEKGYLSIQLPPPLAIGRAGVVELYEDIDYGQTPMRTSPRLRCVGAMRQQAMNFLSAVRGERAPMCNATDALADIQLAREYVRLWKET
jgi:predicted dehydrogenase